MLKKFTNWKSHEIDPSMVISMRLPATTRKDTRCKACSRADHPGHGFGNRFAIYEIILVAVHEGLHKLGWDEPCIVASSA
jgi:hypothetical protein